MLENYNYILVEFYDGEQHLSELYKNINDISNALKVHRSTIYKNYDNDNKYYKVIKNKKEYYIKKII